MKFYFHDFVEEKSSELREIKNSQKTSKQVAVA